MLKEKLAHLPLSEKEQEIISKSIVSVINYVYSTKLITLVNDQYLTNFLISLFDSKGYISTSPAEAYIHSGLLAAHMKMLGELQGKGYTKIHGATWVEAEKAREAGAVDQGQAL